MKLIDVTCLWFRHFLKNEVFFQKEKLVSLFYPIIMRVYSEKECVKI